MVSKEANDFTNLKARQQNVHSHVEFKPRNLTVTEVSTKYNPVICVPCGPGLDVKVQLKSFCSHMIILVIKFVRELCC